MIELRSPHGDEIHCRLADSFARRLLGLMGRKEIPLGSGLLFVPGGSIHTAFMRFPIDAVFINENGVVVDVAEHVRPWRSAHGSGSFVLELAAGDAERLGLLPGEPLQLGGQGLTWQSLNRKRLPSFRRAPGPQQLG